MRHVNSGADAKLSGRVVVIGGGNIGADVARTALRCGADSVELYCLEGYEDMPMGEEDRGECEREGIIIHAGWGQSLSWSRTASVSASDSASACL